MFDGNTERGGGAGRYQGILEKLPLVIPAACEAGLNSGDPESQPTKLADISGFLENRQISIPAIKVGHVERPFFILNGLNCF